MDTGTTKHVSNEGGEKTQTVNVVNGSGSVGTATISGNSFNVTQSGNSVEVTGNMIATSGVEGNTTGYTNQSQTFDASQTLSPMQSMAASVSTNQNSGGKNNSGGNNSFNTMLKYFSAVSNAYSVTESMVKKGYNIVNNEFLRQSALNGIENASSLRVPNTFKYMGKYGGNIFLGGSIYLDLTDPNEDGLHRTYNGLIDAASSRAGLLGIPISIIYKSLPKLYEKHPEYINGWESGY